MITRAKAILGLAPAAPVASKPKVVHLADTADTTNTTETTTPTPKLPIEEIFRFPVVAHSFDLTKIMLHMTIATLFYMRGLLPDMVFSERNLRGASFEKGFIYSQIINGKGVGKSRSHRADYVPTRIIEKNMNDTADHFLNLLEGGIFEAIRQGNLHAVQLTIFDNLDVPEAVLESYTFTFDYSGNRGPADRRHVYTKIDILDIAGDKNAWRDVIRTGESLIRQLITMCARLPILPNQRYMGIHVFYRDECDDSYEIPGFARADDDTIGYPSAGDWGKVSRFCGTLDSGFHTAGVRLSHLAPRIIDLATPIELLEERYDDNLLRVSETGIEEAQIPMMGEVYFSTDESTCSESSPTDPSLVRYLPLDEDGNEDDQGPVQWTYYNITQRLRTMEKMRHNHKRGRPKILANDEPELLTTEAQAKSAQRRAHRRAIHLAESISNEEIELPDVRSRSLRKAQTPEPGQPTDRISTRRAAGQRALEEIREIQKSGLRPTVRAMTVHYIGNRAVPVDKFSDQNDNGESSSHDIVDQIDDCRFTQHAECYGYRHRKDNRLPKIHYCYSCLIGYDFDSELMEKLKKLIRMRRAVKTILFEGIPPSNAILAAHLDCTRDEARELVHSFRKLGLLISSLGWKARGFYKGNDPKFTFATKGPSIPTLASEVLDPMLRIRQYYDIPVLEPPSLLGANFPGCIITKYPPGMEDMNTTMTAPSKKRKQGVMFHKAYDGEHAADSRRMSKKPKKSAKSTKTQRKKK
ncbi:hypothetical protein PENARI_c004G11363 [Penicillium arizonense]|uniref:HORMA domain-containing protein n=1 Tax=Penicillium arizonense TaxID=1835702 RepID=A0A1F5LRZ4_PENAI|nr:hypothetical protein PENARI_c004G11363 [Penicillium arizonense]OGE55621.1 hypothetical protein PENARI_c004G11363 [Penicillium arizonense]